MAVQVHCSNPECGKSMAVAESAVGRSLKCTHCGTKFTASTDGPASKSRPVIPSTTGTGGTTQKVGRFEIHSRLGAGAFATVYRAYDRRLDREVALKVPHPGRLDNATRIERFLREAKAAAGLRHPHIVPIFDAGQDGENSYIAAAYIKGGTLAEAIAEKKPDFRQAARIVRDLAEALAYAHAQGVVHRDVKPANILMDAKGSPHLTDFGLASRNDTSEKLTHDGAVLGTPAYMAPEHAKGQQGDAQPASDQYGLGVILYELLTGSVPFEGSVQIVLFNAVHTEPESPRSRKPGIPLDLETICLKAMSKRPHDRYANCQELADDLRRWLEDEPIRARRVGPVEKFVRWGKRNRALALTGLAAAVLLVAIAVIMTASAIRMSALAAREREALVKAERNAEEAAANLATAQFNEQKAKDKEREATETAKKLRGALDQVTEAERLTKLETEKLKAANIEAHNQAELAREEKERALRSGYVAQVNWAQQAGDLGEMTRLTQLLEDIRPAKGELDLRGYEWYHLWRRSRSDRSLQDQNRSILHLALSPDGRTLALDDDRVVRLWDAVEDKELLVLKDPSPSRGYGTVTFSPDGKLVATCATVEVERRTVGVVRLWDRSTGVLRATLKGHTDYVRCLAFSPDGKLLASGGDAPRLWDIVGIEDKENVELKPRTVLKLKDDSAPYVYGLAFSPDGLTLATVGSDEQINLWNTARGAVRGNPLKGHKGTIYSVAFSPDGQSLASGGDDRTVKVWELTPSSGREKFSLRGFGSHLRSVAYSPDGRFLATASGERFVKLWDSTTGRLAATLPHANNDVNTISFSRDGQTLATGTYGIVRLWNLGGGSGELVGHKGAVHIVRVSRDGRTLVTGAGMYEGSNQTVTEVKAWDVASGKERFAVPGANGFGHDCVVLSPDGKTLAVAAKHPPLKDKAIRTPEFAVLLWDVESGKQRGYLPHDQRIGDLAFSSDGQTLAAASQPDNGTEVKLWNPASTQLRHTLTSGKGGTPYLAFSPDGKHLATSEAYAIQIWDTASGERVTTLKTVDAIPQALGFTPDGRTLVAMRYNLKIWDATTWTERPWPKRPNDNATLSGFRFLAFSPDGSALATVGDRVAVWDLQATDLTAELKGHTDRVFAVAFSPDGRTLATAGADHRVRLWDPASGMERLTLQGHTSRVLDLTFDRDGRTLASCGEDGTVRLWPAATKEEADAVPKKR